MQVTSPFDNYVIRPVALVLVNRKTMILRHLVSKTRLPGQKIGLRNYRLGVLDILVFYIHVYTINQLRITLKVLKFTSEKIQERMKNTS